MTINILTQMNITVLPKYLKPSSEKAIQLYNYQRS